MKNQDNDNGGGKLIDWRKVRVDENKIADDIGAALALIIAINVALCIFPQYERSLLIGLIVGMALWARYSK